MQTDSASNEAEHASDEKVDWPFGVDCVESYNMGNV